MVNRVLTVVGTAALVVGVAAQANAQTTQMPTFELSAGYQLLRGGELCVDDEENGEGEESCSEGQTFPFGVAVDAVRNWGAFGLVGEAGWSRDSDEFGSGEGGTVNVSFNQFHVGAGARWTGRNNPRIWPFVQAIAGAVISRGSVDDGVNGEDDDDSDTDTNFMVQPGVGVHFVAGDGWAIVTQVDYRRVFLNKDETGFSGRNDIRVFVGATMILD